MQELNFLTQYTVPVVVGVCLCVGYVIKTSLDFVPNKYIPLIMMWLGLLTNLAITPQVSVDVALGGMFSGLISTGLHQVFKNIINGGNK